MDLKTLCLEFIATHNFNTWNQTYTWLNSAAQLTYSTNRTCEDVVYESLFELIVQNEISKKSPIYVFTDALPTQDDIRNFEEAVYNKNAFWNAPIYFFYVATNEVNFIIYVIFSFLVPIRFLRCSSTVNVQNE